MVLLLLLAVAYVVIGLITVFVSNIILDGNDDDPMIITIAWPVWWTVSLVLAFRAMCCAVNGCADNARKYAKKHKASKK